LRQKTVLLNYFLYDEIPSLHSLRYPIFSPFSARGRLSGFRQKSKSVYFGKASLDNLAFS
jgi:hypothetical protein